MKAVANSDLPGIIFTMIWEFDSQSDWDYIKEITDMFEKKEGRVCLVELEASTEVRVDRNKTEHRLLHKPTKRDIEWSETELLKTAKEVRMNSNEGEIKSKNYIRINNTEISPHEVAVSIKEKFNFQSTQFQYRPRQLAKFDNHLKVLYFNIE